ncbi:hypothetical protein K445DRAFT_314191 [Daldinia sp. EC12]|nr:hypothetical protein K445DRAFT_314191 [Daldinia sp. EC12]
MAYVWISIMSSLSNILRFKCPLSIMPSIASKSTPSIWSSRDINNGCRNVYSCMSD